MAKRPQNNDEPERIGRTGLGGGQSTQPVHVASPGTRSSSLGPTTFERYAHPQRVVVKAHVVRHWSPQKGGDSISRHVRYLGRESATRDPGSGRFFDAKRDELDAKRETSAWAQDRHHFRVILSPEKAHNLNDLKAYVREVMARVERDRGPLEWIAVNHFNTDHPHAHLLIRGRAQDGSDLVMARQYVSHGIRQRASEVATEWLGERTRNEVDIARTKEVHAERWTSLDAMLARCVKIIPKGLKLDLKELQINRYADTTKELLVARLKFLHQAGLAQPLPVEKRSFVKQQPAWHLASDFQKKLNQLGARNDVIKNLYAVLGKDAARVVQQVQQMSAEETPTPGSRASVRGIVIAKGPINELSDERFVVLEDHAGKAHYARVWADETLDTVRVGGVLEVGRAAHRRWAIADEIIRVAQHAKDALYSTSRHRQWLNAHHPALGSGRIEERLRSFGLKVARLSRTSNSGITRAEKSSVAVDREKLMSFIAGRNRWLDTRIVAAFSFQEQIEAHAYTWLDRQLLRSGFARELPAADIARNAQVRAAIAKRGDWLVEHGYARREDRHGVVRIKLLSGSTARLIENEHKEFARHCNQAHGKRVTYLREGQAVAGIYRGTVYQHRGAFALIEGSQSLYAAPVSGAPWVEKGQAVTARTIAPKFARVELDKTGGRTKQMGMER